MKNLCRNYAEIMHFYATFVHNSFSFYEKNYAGMHNLCNINA